MSLMGVSALALSMEEGTTELFDSYLSELPSELKLSIIQPLIEEIVNNSHDIFEANTQFSQSQPLKNILSINRDFRSFFTEVQTIFKRLLNERFPNPFINKSLKDKDSALLSIFDLPYSADTNELQAQKEMMGAQAVIAGADVNLEILKESNEIESTLLIQSLETGYIKLAKLLIERGADINRKNQQGNTPLLVAVLKRLPSMVETLLNYNASTNIANNFKQTPLFWAAYYGDDDIVKLLMAHDTNVEVEDQDGNTPLSIAKRRGNQKIKKLLKLKKKALQKTNCIVC